MMKDQRSYSKMQEGYHSKNSFNSQTGFINRKNVHYCKCSFFSKIAIEDPSQKQESWSETQRIE